MTKREEKRLRDWLGFIADAMEAEASDPVKIKQLARAVRDESKR